MGGWGGGGLLLGGRTQTPLVSQAMKYFWIGLVSIGNQKGIFSNILKSTISFKMYAGEIRTKRITKLENNDFGKGSQKMETTLTCISVNLEIQFHI